MKALVFRGAGDVRWDDVPVPIVRRPTDAIVRMSATTVSAMDLEIRAGSLPEVRQGRILGHEGVGVVWRTGSGVSRLRVGDRVVVSAVSACGVCAHCRVGMRHHCLDPEGGRGSGWILGYSIDGTHAEYTRVPFADQSALPVPRGVADAGALLVSEVLPTAYEAAVQRSGLRSGESVAIIGAGPVAAAAVAAVGLAHPARTVGIDEDLASTEEEFDAVIDTTGTGASLRLAAHIVRVRGRVVTLGVHAPASRDDLQIFRERRIRLALSATAASSSRLLLRLLDERKLSVGHLITQEVGFDQMLSAFALSSGARANGTLKVLVRVAAD